MPPMFLADRASNSIDRWVNFDRAWPLAGSDGLVSRLRVTEGTEEKKDKKGNKRGKFLVLSYRLSNIARTRIRRRCNRAIERCGDADVNIAGHAKTRRARRRFDHKRDEYL